MNYLFTSYPKEGFGFIYKYTSPSGKSYIGQTINSLSQRSKNGCHYKNSTYFYNAIQKYGFENFKWEIFGEFPIEELSQNEIEFIKEYNTVVPFGYNIRTEEQSLGYTKNTTTQKKAVNKYDLDGNFIQSFESIKDAAKDNNVQPNAISRCCRKITKRSGDYIYRYSDDTSDIKSVSKQQSNSCPVIQYDLDMNYIATYPSLHQAGVAIGKPKADNNIRLVCRGDRNKAYGFTWRFQNEVINSEHI